MQPSKNVTTADLGELVRPGRGPHVSVYMPAFAPEAAQDAIRLKNLLRQVEAGLAGYGLRKPDVATFMAEADAVSKDSAFWRSSGRGVAILLSMREARLFRLPAAFEEIVTVGERFHIKPLLPLLAGDGRYSLLALSRSRVRLFQGDRYSIKDVTPVHLPTSLDQALADDVLEKQSQVHTAGPAKGAGAPRASMYHGHGATERDGKDRTRRFLHIVEAGVRDALRAHGGPLVLAGVDEMRSMYREVNTYRDLIGEGISGSPDGIPVHELHDRAAGTLGRFVEEQRRVTADRFLDKVGTGMVAVDLSEVLSAASFGRVDTLFVAEDRHVWGAFDPASGEVVLREQGSPGDEDLLDRATAHTLMKRGRVFVVPAEEVPGGSEAAALLRY